jgi:hypothetical protein
MAIAVAAAAALLPALMPALPAEARLGSKWNAGPDLSPPLGTTGAEWRDVSATGAADVWAVGVLRTPADNPLTAHWDGRAWTAVPTAKPPTGVRYDLAAVDAVAPGDVWAVGSTVSTTRTAAVLHYTGVWTAAETSAPVVSEVSQLTDVDASATDGWAVGSTTTGLRPTQALIERRQATGWFPVAAPVSDAAATELSAVSARTPDDVWAVGSQIVDGRRAGLILHWDGGNWREWPAPEVGADESAYLESVAATTADEAWAAGRICRTVNGLDSCRPLALRLSGGAWTVVPTSGGGTELTEVVALSPVDVWVIGYEGSTPSLESDHAEHWDGHAFTPDSIFPTAPGGAVANGELASALSAATAIPGTSSIWAVGWTRDPIRGGTHVVRRD